MIQTKDVLVFNIQTKRPACVLLAAAMGGNPSFAHLFDSHHWIIDGAEVDGLRRYGPITRDQVRELAERLGIAA